VSDGLSEKHWSRDMPFRAACGADDVGQTTTNIRWNVTCETCRYLMLAVPATPATPGQGPNMTSEQHPVIHTPSVELDLVEYEEMDGMTTQSRAKGQPAAPAPPELTAAYTEELRRLAREKWRGQALREAVLSLADAYDALAADRQRLVEERDRLSKKLIGYIDATNEAAAMLRERAAEVQRLTEEAAGLRRERDEHIRDKHRILNEYEERTKALRSELAAARVELEREGA
jgi:hypothetical protein